MKLKKGCVEIHWNSGRGRCDPSYQPPMQIVLVKSDWWETKNPGFALSLNKHSSGGKSKCNVRAVRLPAAQGHLRDSFIEREQIDTLLNESLLHRNITAKRCSYVEGLVESIQLQSRKRDAFYEDLGHYQLEIKRAETEIHLDWSDRAEVWPGVMDLVQALEEIYLRLVEKHLVTAREYDSPERVATI